MAVTEDEFRKLIETHQRMVFSLALRITGNYATAEEVAQDVFLSLFRSGEHLDSNEHALFWLRRATKHRAIDAIRRRTRQPEAGAEKWIEEHHTPASNDVSVSGTYAKLETLLQTLPEQLRVIVVLRYQEEMLPEEIAGVMGQSIASVKSQLHRGIVLLRRKAAIAMKEYFRESV